MLGLTIKILWRVLLLTTLISMFGALRETMKMAATVFVRKAQSWLFQKYTEPEKEQQPTEAKQES